jgi:hypothetical protein
MARTARKPTIKKGVASNYASHRQNIYDVGDGQSGALISVERTPDGTLLIEVYRADPDVLVRCDPLNLRSIDQRHAVAQDQAPLHPPRVPTEWGLRKIQTGELLPIGEDTAAGLTPRPGWELVSRPASPWTVTEAPEAGE